MTDATYEPLEPRIVDVKVDAGGADFSMSGYVEFTINAYGPDSSTVFLQDEGGGTSPARGEKHPFTLRVPFEDATSKADALFAAGNVLGALADRFAKVATKAKAARPSEAEPSE